LFVILVILNYKVAIFVVQRCKTILKTAESILDLPRIIRSGEKKGWRFSPKKLEMNIVRHCVKVPCRFARVSLSHFGELTCHSIHRLIREIFGFVAPAGGEDPNQTLANVFVDLTGVVAIRGQPL
jgi:hypothetical protein